VEEEPAHTVRSLCGLGGQGGMPIYIPMLLGEVHLLGRRPIPSGSCSCTRACVLLHLGVLFRFELIVVFLLLGQRFCASNNNISKSNFLLLTIDGPRRLCTDSSVTHGHKSNKAQPSLGGPNRRPGRRLSHTPPGRVRRRRASSSLRVALMRPTTST
jgi:hypothetical protein